MEYAAETLRDDLFLITELGWVDAAQMAVIPKLKKGEDKNSRPELYLKQYNIIRLYTLPLDHGLEHLL